MAGRELPVEPSQSRAIQNGPFKQQVFLYIYTYIYR